MRGNATMVFFPAPLRRIASDYLVSNVLPDLTVKKEHHPVVASPAAIRRHLLQEYLSSAMANDKGLCSSDAIEALFHRGGIDAFDTEALDHMGVHTVLEVVRVLCRNGVHLRRLNAAGQWLHWNSEDLLFRRLLDDTPNLRRLVLQRASFEQLISVLRRCKKLKSLEVRFPCRRSSSLPITSSSPDHPDRIREEEIFPCLQEMTLPSSFGRRELAKILPLFPNLKHLRCHGPFESNIHLMQLETLRIERNDDLDRLVRICPRIRSLSVPVCRGTDLIPLSHLEHLTALHLRNDPTWPLDLANYELWLHSICSKLEVLTLEHFGDIDLSLIGPHCPRRLELFWFRNLNDFADTSRFPRLRSLVLHPTPTKNTKLDRKMLHFLEDLGVRVQVVT